MIKLQCQDCGYEFEVSLKELSSNSKYYKECFLKCGGLNKVINLNEVSGEIISLEVERRLKEYFNTLGIEGTIELISRNSTCKSVWPYIELLRKKGLIK